MNIFSESAEDQASEFVWRRQGTSSGISLKAYPNPFVDHVYFDLKLMTDTRVRIDIYSISGEKIDN